MSFATSRRVELTGYRSGHLEALRFHGTDRIGRAIWLTLCHACGEESPMPGYALRGIKPLKAAKTHCGCLTLRRQPRQPSGPGAAPAERPNPLATAQMVISMRLGRASLADIREVTGLPEDEIRTILTNNKTN